MSYSSCWVGSCQASLSHTWKTFRRKQVKKPADFWLLVNEKGFVKKGKIVVKHGEMLKWLKTDMGLGHVQAKFMILYLRLRTDDPNISDQARKWAYETGYKEYQSR